MAAKLNALQHDLTANLAQLYALRSELSSAQARLKRLEATEAIDEQVLAAQLVGTYEGGQPNIIDVVLQARAVNAVNALHQLTTRVSARRGPMMSPNIPPGIWKEA